jgi:DNA-binding MarR family transcriptional regulator
MLKPIYKVLLEKHIIDFDQLVLSTTEALSLSSLEALALMKLNRLLSKNISLIKPKMFATMLNIPQKEAEALLNDLIEKGYLAFELSTNDGKSKEAFHLNDFIEQAMGHLEKEAKALTASSQHTLITFMEDTFMRPITPPELDILGGLLQMGYPQSAIERAALEVSKYKAPHVKFIHRHLQNDAPKKAVALKADVLSEFKKLWEK